MSNPFNTNLSPITQPTRAELEKKLPRGAVETAEDFESLFIAQYLKTLSENIGENGPLGKDNDVYSSLRHTEMAKTISRAGGVGVADAILREMLKTQEVD